MPAVTFAAERATGPSWPTTTRTRTATGAPSGPCTGRGARSLPSRSASCSRWLLTYPVEEFLATVEEVVGDRGHLHFSGAHGLAEIYAPGVTKAAGLESVGHRLGIDAAHVWAFGDMPNDLPMLEWAGVGWAVANGHERVRRAADRLCPANDDDGVAHVLEAVLTQKV